ncbi:MAG: N-6 DNA methylase [Salinivirgaceae bacterium]|nr:N-6 DNA methylase [Salinivirgaceae bacterium]
MEFKKHNKEEALLKIKDLVERFKLNEKSYKNNAYDESNTRTDFIDKFFEALNWDVRNDEGLAERFRAVVREDKVNIGGQTKAPDYSFRIGGSRVFFVEAKKPSVDIKNDVGPAYQVRRYAYTAKLPISILTDFEEFAIYETNKKPNPTDAASKHRPYFFTYKEYEEKFDFLWDTFSYDAVRKGSLDRFCDKSKRGTGEIDDELLATIEGWRLKLAQNIALRNPDLSLRNLNTAVQKIIDRIVFLRIAEDKDMEEYETLKRACAAADAYKELRKVFDFANAKYNSGLFASEDWLNKLTIDSKVLKDIASELYYPNCPYAWVALPIEILGNIYEKFLGSEITFRNVKGGHTAQVEQKPEVKKAGGVYYTPQYIVEYIVKQTVAKKLEGKKPSQIKSLTICDPACGSGSFLVGAYKYLMNWYLGKYTETNEVLTKAKNAGNVVETTNGLSLSLKEKQRILTTHIFGVDIDAQAVEVTKLSLFLQMLDGEGKQYINHSLSLFRESDLHVLPNLGENIKCGNSLIGSEFYANQELELFDDEAMYKINVFDWDKQFPEIFKNGGFECIIGNPPYVGVERMKVADKEYYKLHYPYFKKRGDLFAIFLEKSLSQLVGKSGYVSFIIKSVIHTNLSFDTLRDYILNNCWLNEVCYTGEKVFRDATVDTTIFVCKKEKNKEIVLKNALDFSNHRTEVVPSNYFADFGNVISVNVSADTDTISSKVFDSHYAICEDYFDIYQGIVTGNNPAFVFDNEQDALDKGIEKELLHPVCHGRDIEKYMVKNHNRRILYIDASVDINNYPNAKKWLLTFKDALDMRNEGKKDTISWNCLHRPREKNDLDIKEKILMQNTRNETLKTRIVATIDDSGVYGTQGLNFIIPKTEDANLHFLIGILNSKLINYIFATKLLNLAIKAEYIKMLRIPPASTTQQQALANLADQMMAAVKKQQKAVSEQDKRIANTRVEAIDKQINQIVYELYGITDPKDIAVIEGISE